MRGCLFQPVKDESGIKYFPNIENAMRVCEILEAETFGRVVYRPIVDFLNRFHLVRKDREGVLRSMTIIDYQIYVDMYLN